MDENLEPKNLHARLYQALLSVVGEEYLAESMVQSFLTKPEIFSKYQTITKLVGFLTKETVDFSINDNQSGIFSNSFDGTKFFGDDITDYTEGINSLNFRSPEFIDNPEIIFSGCSVSYGVGIPADATWIENLRSRINPKSYVALAKPGASAQKIVFTILNYIFKYGKPQKIFVLFPDPYRISSVVDNLNTRATSEKDGKGVYPVDLHLSRDKKNLIKYSKKPHLLNEIFIPEMGFKSAIESIYSLELFCREANIELVWSTWDINTAAIVSVINFSAKNKIFPSFSLNTIKEFQFSSHIDHVNNIDCKPELYEKYGDQYFRATDRGRYHGVHVHSHIADGFFREMERKNKN